MFNKFNIVFMYTNVMYDETVFLGTTFIFICCNNYECRELKQ